MKCRKEFSISVCKMKFENKLSEMQKKMYSSMEQTGELGIVDLLSEVFKLRSKIWWLQKISACEEMEHCHFFNSKILIEVMQSLADVNAYEENENNVEADIRL